MTAAPSLARDAATIRVTGDGYTLQLAAQEFARSPYAMLADASGRRWSRLSLLSSLHTVVARDETWEILEPRVTETDGAVEIVIETRSSAWSIRELLITCTADTVELTASATGTGRLSDVLLLGGDGRLLTGAAGTFRSSIDAESLFVPVPTEPVQFVRPAHSAAVLGVVGDADPGRLNGIFSPPPLALGLGRAAATSPTEVPEGEWLGLSLRAPVEELRFTTLRYEPLDGGFLLRLSYEGHTAVNGRWHSPTVVLRPAASGWGVLDDYRADLVAHGYATDQAVAGPAWWSEPLFCGWGAQVARGGAPAPDLATQQNYDQFLALLDDNDLDPGTIVIDDRWQQEYGTATPHLDRWPDLKGWIAEQHGKGRKVLLWWKAWDPAGIPVDECVTDAGGRTIAVDPGNPAYLRRLEQTVAALLGPDGLDADGFKIDFTQRAPSGQSLTTSAGSRGSSAWGIAALHVLLKTMHDAAKSAKPDALVVVHAVHPSFGDTCDMVRTNDVLERDIHGTPVSVADQLRTRYEIVRRALPGKLIDTDQWPMPSRDEWLDYARVQASLGVPALYYVERINDDEPIGPEHLAVIGQTWRDYRERIAK